MILREHLEYKGLKGIFFIKKIRIKLMMNSKSVSLSPVYLILVEFFRNEATGWEQGISWSHSALLGLFPGCIHGEAPENAPRPAAG